MPKARQIKSIFVRLSVSDCFVLSYWCFACILWCISVFVCEFLMLFFSLFSREQKKEMSELGWVQRILEELREGNV